MLGLALDLWRGAKGLGANNEEQVVEGPGGVGSPIGLLLTLTKAS